MLQLQFLALLHVTLTSKAVHFHIFLSPTLFHPLFSKVHRLPVEECSNFTDCSNCITYGGLLCGWCSVENKCSRRTQCANSNSSDGLRWVQTTDRCLTVDIASAVSISGVETAYPIETSSIVSRGHSCELDECALHLHILCSLGSKVGQSSMYSLLLNDCFAFI